ncbi:FoF1 ATP synthase subunit B' [Nitrosophilus alvini]|uniref:FoF1 ATP synthase subunit B' n=1 Tax=Nitrosophilus alvini TaxID=2714855 RepID=UPI00190B2676|nr:FoF1 ATP synthase subunit B' [Nitrosophilus alvini]
MLDISISLVLLTAILFFILVAVLNSWLYKPLLGFMEERSESIKRDLENASKNTSGSAELKKEAEEILARAKSEAMAIKQSALNEAKALGQSKVDAKKAELMKEYEDFKASLKEEEESLKSALISQMPLFREALKAKFSKL